MNRSAAPEVTAGANPAAWGRIWLAKKCALTSFWARRSSSSSGTVAAASAERANSHAPVVMPSIRRYGVAPARASFGAAAARSQSVVERTVANAESSASPTSASSPPAAIASAAVAAILSR